MRYVWKQKQSMFTKDLRCAKQIWVGTIAHAGRVHKIKCGKNPEKITYSWFYSESVQEQVSAAKLMMAKLKTRKRIREEIT